jgi:transcriptional regulator with PAS, ATPase and Fis domain
MFAVIDRAATESGSARTLTSINTWSCRAMGKATTDSNALWDPTRALREVLDQIRTAGPTDSTVLIEGDTGTGEEVVTTAIHALSDRCNRPFVTLNRAAIPLGLLDTVRKNQLRCDPHQATRSPSRLPRKSRMYLRVRHMGFSK